MNAQLKPTDWLTALGEAIDFLITQHQILREQLTSQPPASFEQLESLFEQIQQGNDQFAEAEKTRLNWLLQHQENHNDPDAMIALIKADSPSSANKNLAQWQLIGEKAKQYQALALANQKLLNRLENAARARIEFLIAPKASDANLYSASGSGLSTGDHRRHLGGA